MSPLDVWRLFVLRLKVLLFCRVLHRHKPAPGKVGLAAFTCANCDRTVLQTHPSLGVALHKADLAIAAGHFDEAERIKDEALRDIGQEP